MTLIDTPGIGSLSADVSARSLAFLTPDDEQTTPSDAVVYLLRHLHAADMAFLHAFHEEEYAQPSPVNCVAVLARADEVSAGRLDAMESAGRIAAPLLGRSPAAASRPAGRAGGRPVGPGRRQPAGAGVPPAAPGGGGRPGRVGRAPAVRRPLRPGRDRPGPRRRRAPRLLLEPLRAVRGAPGRGAAARGARRRRPGSWPTRWCGTAGSTSSATCCSPSSATGGTRSRPARRCWPCSGCWRRCPWPGGPSWPAGSSRSAPGPTSSPSCGCSTACGSARWTSGPTPPPSSSGCWAAAGPTATARLGLPARRPAPRRCPGCCSPPWPGGASGRRTRRRRWRSHGGPGRRCAPARACTPAWPRPGR